MEPIIINNTAIEHTSTAKYLPLIIDHNLTGKQHIEHIRNKLLPYLFILRHTKYTLPMKTKMALYYSYFNSNISYMIPIWGYTTMNHLYRLQKTQNKAIRFLLGKLSRPKNKHKCNLWETKYTKDLTANLIQYSSHNIQDKKWSHLEQHSTDIIYRYTSI